MISASNSIRWLHLSDFHTGKDNYAQRKIFARILEHVRETLDKGFKPDFVFITGDLANKGKTEGFELFSNEFLVPLLSTVGGECEKRTFVVPGNHDVDRTQSAFFSREDICDSKSRFFDPTDEGLGLRKQILPRFEPYESCDYSACPPKWISSAQGSFGQILEILGRKIGVVGINTAWLSKDNEDRHKLSPGKPAVEAALDAIAHCDARIVLGHHPLDWFVDREVSGFRALFGKHRVIYLHGHLHEVRGLPEDGSGKPYLAIQCGAGFQARENEVWRNGLLWAELDFETEELRLQPRHWEPNNHDWPTTTGAFPELRRGENSDWWAFPSLEVHQPLTTDRRKQRAKATSPKIPDGWQLLTKDGLSGLGGPLDEEAAIQFFNGAVPTWQLAVSSSIPRRRVVPRLAEFLTEAGPTDRPRVALMLAASGEGKSTALLQAIYEVCRCHEDWKVLRRSDETQPVSVDDVISIVSTTGPWLVVTDEADQVANRLFDLVKLFQQRGRGDVHFLIASRDTDWIAAKAYADNWWSHSSFREEKLRGLDEADAASIVRAWAAFGKAALGRLASLGHEAAVKALIEAAQEEARLPQGSFFGAMLTVRFGDDLQEHLRLLLQRLGTRTIPGNATLQDAIAYVAAIHAVDLELLSRPVLARVLGCPSKDLKRHVLLPLGEEAAATTTSQFVFTRHRRVATAVLDVLSNAFGEDTDRLFEELAGAALDAYGAGEYIPELTGWRYNLADKLSSLGRNDLAIRVSRAVLQRESSNTKTMVKLAQLYREANSLEEAVSLFRAFHGDVTGDRPFFHEWGMSEGQGGDLVAGAWLSGHAVSDQCGFTPPDNKTAMIVLTGLCASFKCLFAGYSDPVFLEGKAAAAVLGLRVSLDEASSAHFQEILGRCVFIGSKTSTLDESCTSLQRAVEAAARLCAKKEIRDRLMSTSAMSFQGLRQLAERGTRRRSC
jgi:calcineurin-like phosphoesterase family protein